MLANFHTHTTFCDGKNTPEEIVLAAMEHGFSAIGFSGHGNTVFDLRYCMTDTEGYITEINRLKEAYGKSIQIYLGVEEDAFCLTDRSRFDYIIGSLHYVYIDGQYLPVDSGLDYMNKCLSMCDGDANRLAETYYSALCSYIRTRKPDIIGHFDLITKYDETSAAIFLDNPRYQQTAEKYIRDAARSGCIFEVNTGAMARGLRTRPYPDEKLLHILKKEDAKIILSSDSHSAETLDFGFAEAKALLREIGFRHTCTLHNGSFVTYNL